MKFLKGIVTAKTSTLMVLTFVLSLLTVLVPWVSFVICDLSDWLLSATVIGGNYRITDKRFFDLLDSIYGAWWSVVVQFFYVLIVAQLVVVVSVSVYFLRALYYRWKAGTARLWQFIIPMILLCLAVAFTTAVLYLSYVEVSVLRKENNQVDVIDEKGSVDSIFSAGRSHVG